MAIAPERIDYLTSSKVRILSSTLTEEEQEFRKKWLKVKQREERLLDAKLKRKADFDSSYVPNEFAYCDWSSDEEFREWLYCDRKNRVQILDDILADPNWLETLGRKYYGDNWEIVYADSVDGGVNWKRETLPKKKQYKQDVKED
jgi:hypothetical protein